MAIDYNRTRGREAFDRLALRINSMKPGENIKLDITRIVDLEWNDWIYGHGREGFERAVRGNVMGSAFGSVTFHWPLLGDDSVMIKKHECGERIFDRDGEPIVPSPCSPEPPTRV